MGKDDMHQPIFLKCEECKTLRAETEKLRRVVEAARRVAAEWGRKSLEELAEEKHYVRIDEKDQMAFAEGVMEIQDALSSLDGLKDGEAK